MQPKKNPKFDLERKRGLYLQLGFIIALLLVFIAFEYKSYDNSDSSLGKLKLDDLDSKFEVYINEKRNESLLNKEQLRLQIKSIKGTKDGDPFVLTTLDGYQPLVEGQNIFDIISPALLTIKDGVIDSIHS